MLVLDIDSFVNGMDVLNISGLLKLHYLNSEHQQQL